MSALSTTLTSSNGSSIFLPIYSNDMKTLSLLLLSVLLLTQWVQGSLDVPEDELDVEVEPMEEEGNEEFTYHELAEEDAEEGFDGYQDEEEYDWSRDEEEREEFDFEPEEYDDDDGEPEDEDVEGDDMVEADGDGDEEFDDDDVAYESEDEEGPDVGLEVE
ncbi:hypothetical protein MPSEU_000018500 [Mayamaea pseudoterrestris]|nr:hypothetical protein MPSEU_000018500 [Mayamaea pseudoterrestris]